MAKNIKLLGMEINNYTVRESALQLDTYLSSTVLNIIETVTMNKVLMSQEKSAIGECIAQADMTLIADKEMLGVAEASSLQRVREIKENEFLYEMLRRVIRNQKTVFLIAMTREEVEHMQKFLISQSDKIKIAGTYAVEESLTDEEAIINEINGATPDVVLSAMTSPYEEEFILAHKDKLSLSIWYGMGTAYNKGGNGVAARVKNVALWSKLHHAMQKYDKESQRHS